ncbi:chemotaxis protein chel [Rhodobacteraceae bacterium WD3A24]|nr:chemotaxis protein chel [Rhodobacteraceae bacterium WD3A24]
MTITPPLLPDSPQPARHPARPDRAGSEEGHAALRRSARDLEARFLSEMLKAAGVGEPRDTFGGGAGEEQFASFVARFHAEALTERGGIGLSKAIFDALVERADGHDSR